jgi:TolB-like protein/DNA-binding winged helix-turn-helix (wHTH) protein/Flp pilus assembly protein TadD
MRWCDSEAVHVGDTAREIRGKFEGFNVATRFGAFVLDSDLRQLTREGAEIHLTPKAFDLLMVLVAEAGRVVRKPELHQRLWPRTFVSDATLVSLVKELRRALDDRDSGAPVIRTAHGVGYAFIAPIERHAPQRAEVSCWIIAGGRRIPLHIGDNLIGRDPASAVCLDEAGVSPRHARIVVGERGALLEDLGSKNGTSVGKIPVTGQVPLQDGDQLHVGPNVIIYHASATRRDGEHLATERRSIAVLPFSDMSPQKDQEYFCEGIAEELIHTLAAIDGLQVPARSSSFQFAGKPRDISEVGARLKVDTVLEGSIRKAGNRLRITVQLVNVSDGYHLWSERYDRNLDDVFAVQDEIARAIVDKLRVTLRTGRPLVKRQTDDLEAYRLYLQGRYYWSRLAGRFVMQAMACFEQAIARDASYALAHAGLANAYTVLGMFGVLPPRAAWNKAKLAAQQALLLSDELGEAHGVIASIHFFFDWDFVTAEREFRRAIALNPNSGHTHAAFGYLLGILGRFEEAIAEAARGRDLEPMSPLVGYYGAGTFGCARRFDDGLDECRRVLDLDPSFAPACWAQSIILTTLGRHDAAVDAVERALTLSPDFLPGPAGMVYAAAGQREKADAILAKFRARSPRDYVLPLTFVWVAIVRGEIDQAFEWLERAYEARSPMLPTIGVWSLYDPLRGDPRFGALLKRVGLDGVVPARS